MNNKSVELIEQILEVDFGKSIENATANELHEAITKYCMNNVRNLWKAEQGEFVRTAYYMSAEFLVGRQITSNLLNMQILQDVKECLQAKGRDINFAEDISDMALGNGGLGRLAACYLESGASVGKKLDGYGIRYKYGLFEQSFEGGCQKEVCDDWAKFGDPWSERREDESVIVELNGTSVLAVPYDMPIIGYGGKTINTLRLWQAEHTVSHSFEDFNSMNYDKFLAKKAKAEMISYLLYPNDETKKGKALRLSQQYFFCSASLKDMIRKMQKANMSLENFSKYNAIQLNDTHPVISILELIRLLEEFGISFTKAFNICTKTFAFTNHTILGEALEKWDLDIVKKVVPNLFKVAKKVQLKLRKEKYYLPALDIISDNKLNMANLAIYCCKCVNGVAQLHTNIIKADLFKEWNSIDSNKFLNITNGITHRRWFLLSAEKMAKLVEGKIGDDFKADLSQISKIKKYADSEEFITEFKCIKNEQKQELARYIFEKENIDLPTNFCFDIQIKRLHEYKRQLLNAMSILHFYFEIKAGNIKDFKPTAFIFGAKSAPGYYMAKAIIKLINEIAQLVNNDSQVNKFMRVVFVSNYNVSYAEKLVTAADISEQISLAGLEASGTGNMKFMLNGTVTLGTMDGANVEIVEEAGRENNYIFGATTEEVAEVKKDYNPLLLYNTNPKIKRVLDALIDGTLNDNVDGVLRCIYNDLLKENGDKYLNLYDFDSYIETKQQAIKDYDTSEFYKKCIINMASAGKFSSDRSIKEYCENIWEI